MKPVVLLDEAYKDLERGRDFYEEKDAGLGDYFTTSLLTDIAALAELHGFHSQRLGFNWVPASKFPFGIYYLESQQDVIVYAVLDQRTRPSRIRRQLKKRGP